MGEHLLPSEVNYTRDTLRDEQSYHGEKHGKAWASFVTKDFLTQGYGKVNEQIFGRISEEKQ